MRAPKRWLAILCLLSTACGPVLYVHPSRYSHDPPREPQRDASARRVLEVASLPASEGESGRALPFESGQVWRGAYLCPQGDTNLDFVIADTAGDRVRAVFDFHHVPSGARGAYVMDGRLDGATGEISFEARAWLERPPHYVTVDMRGQVARGERRFSGEISNPECGDFELTLVE